MRRDERGDETNLHVEMRREERRDQTDLDVELRQDERRDETDLDVEMRRDDEMYNYLSVDEHFSRSMHQNVRN